jgi:hypothetical protein
VRFAASIASATATRSIGSRFSTTTAAVGAGAAAGAGAGGCGAGGGADPQPIATSASQWSFIGPTLAHRRRYFRCEPIQASAHSASANMMPSASSVWPGASSLATISGWIPPVSNDGISSVGNTMAIASPASAIAK